jgi:DNA modification methylase
MKDIPDKSVDLVLTDPPYGVNLDYDIYQDTEENWFKLMEKIIPEVKRVAKMVIMPSCQIKRLKWIYNHFPPDWLICWYKGSVGSAGFVGFNDWEPHLVYGKNTNTMHDYFKATPEPFGNNHPCPKPLLWAEWLISRATKEEQIVLDPFMGSGTTCVAAKHLGRNFIGIEISPEYCKIAKERLRQEVLF